jgi:hypothetical protein
VHLHRVLLRWPSQSRDLVAANCTLRAEVAELKRQLAVANKLGEAGAAGGVRVSCYDGRPPAASWSTLLCLARHRKAPDAPCTRVHAVACSAEHGGQKPAAAADHQVHLSVPQGGPPLCCQQSWRGSGGGGGGRRRDSSGRGWQRPAGRQRAQQRQQELQPDRRLAWQRWPQAAAARPGPAACAARHG